MLVVVLFKILLPSMISMILLFSYFKVLLGYFDATKKINYESVENHITDA